METDKWKRYIRVTGASATGSVLCFYGGAIATIDSDDWILDMEAVLDELYELERSMAESMAKYLANPDPNGDGWKPPIVQLTRNIVIMIINALPAYTFPDFPFSKPGDIKWRRLDTSRCTDISVEPKNANTRITVY